MTLAEQQGAASAFKKMADRRFKMFECNIQEVIERGRYDEEDYKNVKDLKRDTEENIDMYEDIITYLDGVYSAKPAKKEEEMKELVENFDMIAERRDTVRKKVKEANIAIEKETN